MNALVVYFTQFGNTQKVAEVIAEVLTGEGEAYVMSIDGLAAADLEDASLVVFGSPTHYQNLPKEVRTALDTLPKRVLRGKRVAAFKLGGKKVASPETYLVTRGEVPESGERQDALCEGELERARAWAASLLDHSQDVAYRGRIS
jgi:flavodoxin